MSIVWCGPFDNRGDEGPYPNPIPGHEPQPDEPEPDDETRDLVRPVQT